MAKKKATRKKATPKPKSAEEEALEQAQGDAAQVPEDDSDILLDELGEDESLFDDEYSPDEGEPLIDHDSLPVPFRPSDLAELMQDERHAEHPAIHDPAKFLRATGLPNPVIACRVTGRKGRRFRHAGLGSAIHGLDARQVAPYRAAQQNGDEPRMAPAESRPDDLQALLGELRSARTDTTAAALFTLWPRLRAMSRRHLPAHSALRAGLDSEDLTQDGLLQLVQNVDRFRGTSWPEFLAFVHAILAQKKGQHVRRQAVRRAELATGSPSDEVAADTPTPSVDAMAAEDRHRLRELVGALPEPYRTAVRLRLEGFDNAAVALQLGIGRDAVRQRLSRAVKLLQERW